MICAKVVAALIRILECGLSYQAALAVALVRAA
jgi:hypothetical protein